MGIFNEFNKKEKPVFTGSRFGFGAGSAPDGPFTYDSYFYRLSPSPFEFAQYTGSGGRITMLTVFGSDGTSASSTPQGNPHPGGNGGNSQLKYIQNMPIDNFVTSYGVSVDITNTMTAPYWASADGDHTAPGGTGSSSAGAAGGSGSGFGPPAISSINDLFPTAYTFAAGSGGSGGSSPPNQYGGKGGGGGAGGVNVTQSGGITIPSDPAASPGGTGGNAPGTPGSWPGRDGAPGGAGGGGQYGAGGGGGGSGSELSGNIGAGGAGGSGQGGLTIIHIFNV